MPPIKPEVQGTLNRYRYARSLSCLEEFIEAISFSHYIQTQQLISHEAVSAALPADILLTEGDYILGIFDLGGEMMRLATAATALTGEIPGGGESGTGRTIVQDIQHLGSMYEILPPLKPGKSWWDKMKVMRENTRKVERLGYSHRVRGSERPKGWMPDLNEAVLGDDGGDDGRD